MFGTTGRSSFLRFRSGNCIEVGTEPSSASQCPTAYKAALRRATRRRILDLDRRRILGQELFWHRASVDVAQGPCKVVRRLVLRRVSFDVFSEFVYEDYDVLVHASHFGKIN